MKISTLAHNGYYVPGRRQGNTTRLVNFAVEQIMNGQTVVCHDHHENGKNKHANKNLFDRVLKRLSSENNLIHLVNQKEIDINSTDLTIGFIK